jgi:hypothetical protein
VPREELDVSPDAPVDQVKTDYLSHRAAQFVEVDFIGPFGIRIIPGLRGEYESVSRTYQIDPRLSLVYLVSQYGTITAAFGQYHQCPDPMYFDPYTGNPGLSQLRAVHTIVGYMYQRKNTLFRLEAYYKTYDGLLLEDDELNYTNQGEGYARGMDLFLKHAMGPVSFRLAYSWLKARRRWMDLPVLASPYFDIPHNLTVVLNWDILDRLSIGLSFWHATGKPYTPGPGRYHESRVPDYQKLDLTVTYLHSFFAGNTTVFYVGASNILGRINIFDYRYSSDWQRREAVESTFGRSIYFGFSFTM